MYDVQKLFLLKKAATKSVNVSFTYVKPIKNYVNIIDFLFTSMFLFSLYLIFLLGANY